MASRLVTGSSAAESWAMAIGIDLGFVSLEVSQISIGERLRRHVGKYARPAIVGTLIGSAGMNAFAFPAQAANVWTMAAAIGLGVAIPALVFAMTKVGALMWIDTHAGRDFGIAGPYLGRGGGRFASLPPSFGLASFPFRAHCRPRSPPGERAPESWWNSSRGRLVHNASPERSAMNRKSPCHTYAWKSCLASIRKRIIHDANRIQCCRNRSIS
jgi:hypothetical protein